MFAIKQILGPAPVEVELSEEPSKQTRLEVRSHISIRLFSHNLRVQTIPVADSRCFSSVRVASIVLCVDVVLSYLLPTTSSSTYPKMPATSLQLISPTATRQILAPLTTIFTPAATCNSYIANGVLEAQETYWQGQACSGGGPVDTASCWPPVLVADTSTPFHGRGFYSPGGPCPVGYSSACTAALMTNGSPSPLALGTSFLFEFPLTAGETAIGCCPS